MSLLALVLLPLSVSVAYLCFEMARDKRQLRSIREKKAKEEIAMNQPPMARLHAMKRRDRNG